MRHLFGHFIFGMLLPAVLWAPAAACAQSVDEIKASRLYYWGEDVGKTPALAEKKALSMLIGQISVSVESKFNLLKEEVMDKNASEIKEQMSAVINTYSNATIKNTERLTWGDEPEVHMLLYVKKSEVYKIFEERERKIKEFVETAETAEQKLQVADALKYYYWALMLLQSLPDGNSITLEANGKAEILAVYLPKKINGVFDKLKFEVVDKQEEPNLTIYRLGISYDNRQASNCDYSVFSGNSWSAIMGAKDGQGVAEILGDPSKLKNVRINVEYVFGDEWKMDPEVKDVLEKVEPVAFKKSRFEISLADAKAQAPQQPQLASASSVQPAATEAFATFPSGIPGAPDASAKPAKTLGAVEDGERYLALLKKVEAAIRSKNYEAARSCFTPDGYDVFTRLVAYGNAVIISAPAYALLKFEDGVLARSLPMRFSFKNNRKVFVEDVVFDISEREGKIRSLSFGLSNVVCNEIMQQERWDEYSKIAIINFLENYKTAYALKRLDYIESIFSDNALIIVGKVVKSDPTVENRFSNKRVELTRYTKTQYVRQLGTVFRSNEYVNIKFTDVNVQKAGKGGEIYGIQLNQGYLSTSYGDTGYLFLLADLNNPEKPVIHVRAWQPEKDPDFGVYSLANF
ncbi:MAG: hypothetical protein LBK18_00420 [Prevotellaceae bacterium]|jgi:hypothetical protein|nr:hypothetical protein [Prevotellaceae bacterium]